MPSKPLIEKYQKTIFRELRHEILLQIGDVSDEDGLRFLLGVIVNDDGEEDDRLGAIEALKFHGMTPQSDEVFDNLMNWLEKTHADEDLQVHAAQVIAFCGFDKPRKRERILGHLRATNRRELVAECLLTDIGIHGRGKFAAKEIEALKTVGLDELVRFVLCEWRGQSE